MFPKPHAFIKKLIKKEQFSEDTYGFYFDKGDMTYLPGQYIKMTLDIPNSDERGNMRFFTLASSPHEDFLLITTRIIQSTFKKGLHALPIGSDVQFFGPLGRFIFDSEMENPRIFLAGGIGITPFRSMVLYAKEMHIQSQLYVFTSFKHKEDIVFSDDFADAVKQNQNIHTILSITDPHKIHIFPLDIHSGRINEELIKKSVPEYRDCFFYISGPITMVDGLTDIVLNLGIPEERIKKENFSGY